MRLSSQNHGRKGTLSGGFAQGGITEGAWTDSGCRPSRAANPGCSRKIVATRTRAQEGGLGAVGRVDVSGHHPLHGRRHPVLLRDTRTSFFVKRRQMAARPGSLEEGSRRLTGRPFFARGGTTEGTWTDPGYRPSLVPGAHSQAEEEYPEYRVREPRARSPASSPRYPGHGIRGEWQGWLTRSGVFFLGRSVLSEWASKLGGKSRTGRACGRVASRRLLAHSESQGRSAADGTANARDSAVGQEIGS